MGYGHGRVALEQQHGHRLADHKATPDDEDAPARDLDAVVVQNLDAGLRRARSKGPVGAGKQRTERTLATRVDVLVGCQGIADPLFVDVRGERAQYEQTVNGIIRVDGFDGLHELFRRHALVEHEVPYGNAHDLGALACATLVREVVGPLAHAQYAQAWRHALRGKRGHAVHHVFADRLGDRRSLEYRRAHRSRSPTSAMIASALGRYVSSRSYAASLRAVA